MSQWFCGSSCRVVNRRTGHRNKMGPYKVVSKKKKERKKGNTPFRLHNDLTKKLKPCGHIKMKSGFRHTVQLGWMTFALTI